jgi:hypothetical protein
MDFNMAMKHGLCTVPVDWVMVVVPYRPVWLCFALEFLRAERVGRGSIGLGTPLDAGILEI